MNNYFWYGVFCLVFLSTISVTAMQGQLGGTGKQKQSVYILSHNQNQREFTISGATENRENQLSEERKLIQTGDSSMSYYPKIILSVGGIFFIVHSIGCNVTNSLMVSLAGTGMLFFCSNGRVVRVPVNQLVQERVQNNLPEWIIPPSNENRDNQQEDSDDQAVSENTDSGGGDQQSSRSYVPQIPLQKHLVHVPVLLQQGGTCAYHAVLNTELIASLLANNSQVDPVTAVHNNPLLFNRHIVSNFINDSYNNIVFRARRGNINLDENVLVDYNDRLKNLKILATKGIFSPNGLDMSEEKFIAKSERDKGKIQDPLDVVELYWADSESGIMQSYYESVKRMVILNIKNKLAHTTNYRHLLVLGVWEGGPSGGGHAVALVVEKRGQDVWLLFADSGGFQPLNNPQILDFIQELELT